MACEKKLATEIEFGLTGRLHEKGRDPLATYRWTHFGRYRGADGEPAFA